MFSLFPQVVADTNISAIAAQLENMSTGYHLGSPTAEHHPEDTEWVFQMQRAYYACGQSSEELFQILKCTLKERRPKHPWLFLNSRESLFLTRLNSTIWVLERPLLQGLHTCRTWSLWHSACACFPKKPRMYSPSTPCFIVQGAMFPELLG